MRLEYCTFVFKFEMLIFFASQYFLLTKQEGTCFAIGEKIQICNEGRSVDIITKPGHQNCPGGELPRRIAVEVRKSPDEEK